MISELGEWGSQETPELAQFQLWAPSRLGRKADAMLDRLAQAKVWLERAARENRQVKSYSQPVVTISQSA
jgi:hypothetical protein